MLTLLFAFLVMAAIILLPTYQKYQKSEYKVASGNNFIQTVFNAGNYGEFHTYLKLEKLEGNNRLMTNLYLPKADGSTTEVDLIMIAETGIYVYESKNYSGWIFGNEKQKNWTQSLPNKQKNKFYNPIWQNNGHISALKHTLEMETPEIYKSYIIFSERCTLKKITVTSESVKVIKRDDLVASMKKDMAESDKILTGDEVEVIYQKLQQYVLADEAMKLKHIESVKLKQVSK